MNRRSFLGVVGCAFGTVASNASSQQPRIYRIGYLHPTGPQDVGYPAFRRGMTDLGYVFGANAIIEERFAERRLERLPGMAAELVANRVDVIVAVSPPAIQAARAATRTIPIVMAFSGSDPVRYGFAASLARPGGNTTGVTAVLLDIAPKWLELLRDLVPGLKTVAVLRYPFEGHTATIGILKAAAEASRIRLNVVEVGNADGYEQAFAASAGAGSQAIIVLPAPEFSENRARIVELANRYRLPSLFQYTDFVPIGGLVSYGPDIADLAYRAAAYVDKILKGANPAEMPIEQPRKLFLLINRRTASALGLTIPPALLLLADQVFQ